MTNPSDREIAWFAGLFEGEGCIHIGKNGTVYIAIAMTDKDVIDRVNTMFPMPNGITPIIGKPRINDPNPKTLYRWRVGRQNELMSILEKILPDLGKRRRNKALEALRHCESRPGRKPRKTHCPKGHEYSPENTYNYGGHRHCRTCASEWERRNRDKIYARQRLRRLEKKNSTKTT